MTTHLFRFGVVGTDARRAETLGYATLLVPGFDEAVAAAAVTTTLRIGTYEVAGSARAVARQAARLHVVTGGRFELGVRAEVARKVDPVDGVPMLIAGSGSGVLRVAAAKADTVALPLMSDEQAAAELDELYELAGDRFHRLELGMAAGQADTAETLCRRRDELGISFVSVNAHVMEDFAPIVERLAGT